MPFFGGGSGDYHINGTNITGGAGAMPAVVGSNNMALGNGAGASLTLSDQNIFIGNGAAPLLTDLSNNNIVIGYLAAQFSANSDGFFTGSQNNVMIGGEIGSTQTGTPVARECVIIGYKSGGFGTHNSFYDVIIGSGCTAINNGNVLIGYQGDPTRVYANGNDTVIGYAAISYDGNGVAVGALSQSGKNSVAIGQSSNANPSRDLLRPAIAIGASITANAGQIVIGDASYTSVIIGGVTLSSATGANFPSAIVGNPGTEGTGINIGGVTYDAPFKVSDISSADIAQSIIHRHSTTWEPIQVFARSNSNGSGHGAVVNGMLISSQYSAGWTGTEYNLFGRAGFEAAATGTISDASSPGDFVIATTPNGGTLPVEAVRVGSDKTATFTGGVVFASSTFAWLPAAGTSTGKVYFVSDVGVGGSYWVSDGTKWKLLNEYKILYQSVTPINFTNTVDAILASVQIPAGLLKQGFGLRIQQKTTKSGTVDSIARNLRIGTTNTTADLSLMSAGQPATTNTQVAEEQYFFITSNTTLLPTGTGALAWNGASGNAVINSVNIADVSANAIFVSISEYFTSRTTETGTLAYFEIGLITP